MNWSFETKGSHKPEGEKAIKRLGSDSLNVDGPQSMTLFGYRTALVRPEARSSTVNLARTRRVSLISHDSIFAKRTSRLQRRPFRNRLG